MLRYTGAGFIPDVPARDLSAAEAEAFGVEVLVRSGCYAVDDVDAEREMAVLLPPRRTRRGTVRLGPSETKEG